MRFGFGGGDSEITKVAMSDFHRQPYFDKCAALSCAASCQADIQDAYQAIGGDAAPGTQIVDLTVFDGIITYWQGTGDCTRVPGTSGNPPTAATDNTILYLGLGALALLLLTRKD